VVIVARDVVVALAHQLGRCRQHLREAQAKLGVEELLHLCSDDVRKKYLRLSKLVHPDKLSHPLAVEAFQRLNRFYETALAASSSSQATAPTPGGEGVTGPSEDPLGTMYRIVTDFHGGWYGWGSLQQSLFIQGNFSAAGLAGRDGTCGNQRFNVASMCV